MTTRLSGGPDRHPLASAMAIRTVDLVPLEGATLVRESGPGAQNPVPPVPDTTKLTPRIGTGAQPGESVDVGPESYGAFPSRAVVCAFHGE